MKAVPVNDARRLGQAAGADRLVIIAIGPGGVFSATSWGRDVKTCRALGRWLDSPAAEDVAVQITEAR